MAAVAVRDGEPPEVVTDLDETEHAKFRRMSAVDVDDMLNLSEFLEGFDGDFSRLFFVEGE